MSGMAPKSNPMMCVEYGIGQGGSMHPPRAAPPSSTPISNDVHLVMENMFRLSCISPEQAERILRCTAALQGPYQD